MDIVKKLQTISRSHWYWLAYIGLGITSLLIALIYQYILDEPPCVVCIQIRLWFTLLVLVGAGGLLFRRRFILNLAMQLGVVLGSVGLVERSYLLLGTERGFIFSDCGFDAGLPAWFAIEQWLPWLYQVETSCGYTPEMLFGISMAETLIVLSVCLAIVSITVIWASLLGALSKKP